MRCRRTQQGNNNAYCQDNELSWLDWENADETMLVFTRNAVALRRTEPVFRRPGWFCAAAASRGRDWPTAPGSGPDAVKMDAADWDTPEAKTLMLFLNGEGLETQTAGVGRPGDSFLLLFNAHHESVEFTLPPMSWGTAWTVALDTATPQESKGRPFRPPAWSRSSDARCWSCAAPRADAHAVSACARPRRS